MKDSRFFYVRFVLMFERNYLLYFRYYYSDFHKEFPIKQLSFPRKRESILLKNKENDSGQAGMTS